MEKVEEILQILHLVAHTWNTMFYYYAVLLVE